MAFEVLRGWCSRVLPKRKPRRRRVRGGFGRASELLEGRALLSSSPAAFVVDVPHDISAPDGVTTLREAVDQANNHVGTDIVSFAPGIGSLISLAQPGPIEILEDLTIDGPGQSSLSVHGVVSYDVFTVGTGVTATIQDITLISTGYGTIESDGVSLTIKDSTIKINPMVPFATDSNIVNRLGDLTIDGTWVEGIGHNTISNGGGIFHTGGGTLTITNGSTIHHHNAGVAGGGIYNDGSIVRIDHSTISRNSTTSSIDLGTGAVFQWPFLEPPDETPCDPAFDDSDSSGSGSGGGLYNNGGRVEITHTTFNDNRSHFDGGAILSIGVAGTYNGVAELEIIDSTFNCNRVAFGMGGAIANIDGTGKSIVDLGLYPPLPTEYGYSTFERNIAEEGGGAIFNLSELTLFNSTISNNRARGMAPMTSGDGGGIYQGITGFSDILFVTFARNDAAGRGGALHVEDFGIVDVDLTHSLFAFNPAIGKNGKNDVSDPGSRIDYFCVNLFQAPPLLDLDYNITPPHIPPTRTHALPGGHPAIDRGCWDPEVDQRHYLRTNREDVGSYEGGASSAPHPW